MANQFGEASKGIAVDAGNGVVFASDVVENDVVFFDPVTLPTVSLTALSEQTPKSVTLNGTVNPEGSPVTSCEFEYVPASEYESGTTGKGYDGIVFACESWVWFESCAC